jgi:D-beta-D-heptose 7-phosphate kinase/D-beta-D-heptose 1-phosphate adenosyltransferase
VAAGLEVERIGVAAIPRDEIRAVLVARQATPRPKVLSRQELTSALASDRLAGKRIVFTNGCFDLLHVGHITYLQEARSWGERLVIAVNSDASVRKLKGPQRPVISEQDRAAVLAALACVDYVVVFDEDTPLVLLDELRPDVLVKGGTYQHDEVVGHELVESYGGRVVVTSMLADISTTAIVRAVTDRHVLPPPHYDAAAASSQRKAG